MEFIHFALRPRAPASAIFSSAATSLVFRFSAARVGFSLAVECGVRWSRRAGIFAADA